MSRVTAIIGAGNLGANIAYFLSEQGIGNEICLYDSFTGRAQGKMLDMIEAQPIRRTLPKLRGVDSLDAIDDSSITIISLSADMFVDAGDDRQALQAAVSKEIAQIVSHLKGYQGVVVVASPYEQELLPLLHTHSKIDSKRLIGLGTVPHSMYATHLISRETGIDPRQIQLLIIGSAEQPIVLTETARIASIPLSLLYPDISLDSLLGDSIAKFTADTRSNYYRVASAVARVAEAIDSDLKRTLSVASLAAAEYYGTSGQPFAMPSVVSSAGVSIQPFAEARSVHDACAAAASNITEKRV